MLNSLRDGQINYGTTNCSSAHVASHNVVAQIHQNPILPNEHTTPMVYPWNSNPRLDHLYGFHSRYYNLDFPTPYPPATNQYVPQNIYSQNIPQCCQPCCRLRSQNIPKTSPPQVLYNPIRPVQQLNRSYKSKKAVKTPCSEQFLPYIPNELPVKYDTQNCYQQKYNNSYLNNTNYCPPANNLWIPSAPNPTWSTDRLRPVSCHTDVVSHNINRNKNYSSLPNYQSNPYPNPTSATHHRPYNYIPPIPDVNDYRPSVYHHNPLKNNSSDYSSQEQNARLPISSQNNQIPLASFQQYYNAQPVSYSDVSKPSESFKPPQITQQNSSKSNLNVREFLANWDEGEEETCEKLSETTAPIVVLDCMTVEGDALTKIQEKLNVVSYEHLEKVLKENQNPVLINTESNEIDFIQNKAKPLLKPNFEPLDYTKRETGIIKPFITEKKTSSEINTQSEKSYSVNFDGMVAWYGKKKTDISSTDLIERLADRIFNLSKSQENDGVSFGTAAYTGQITQANRSIVSSAKDSSKYLQSRQIFDLNHSSEKCIEPSSITNKLNSCNDYNNDSIPKSHSFVSNEKNEASFIKSNNTNSSCIVENITKKCLNVTNEHQTPWNLDHSSQEQHLNTSLYDHSVIIKPLDFSSLTDETKGNPFAFDKNTSIDSKANNHINDQYNKIMNENNNYNFSNNQHSIQQIDSSNRNFPVIVSPNIHRQEYNGFHESVIQRTGCGDKNKHDKVPTQTDFESMNWNISNDLDKIMKNSHIPIMEPSCMYDRNNYNILDNINSNKNLSNQWKDIVPCIDLTVNSKSNSNHDSFFEGWNFIESYENNSNKKIINMSSNNNEVHNQTLYPNMITSLEESKNKNSNSSDKIENETLSKVKNISFSKPNNARPRNVFNLNNRIPDFSDGFELPIINEPHEYMQFKKSSNDSEHRTDGSIFEHLTESKYNRPTNETTVNAKNDQIKSDNVGLPSFKEKEPLAPMLVPPKLNIVKPIIRDPSKIYTVIKQKVKYDNNSSIDNDNVIANKTGHNLIVNQTNDFNGADLKSKYNNGQMNQFDVWSEKFVLKGNTNDSSSTVVQCDVEITQFKSTPENRNTLILKSNMGEHFQEKNTKLQENTNCNLTGIDKININEDDKINSNDFLNCLESTKTDDQKYQDTLDEFETSFGFDIHCDNESNKSFHEDIVDKCLEESIKDQIGEHNVNTSNSINMSNNTQSPFQCDFQSDFLIKNHFDENKNKAVILDEKQTINHEKSSTVFIYHNEIEHNFALQDHKNENKSNKNLDFDILNNVNHDTKQNQNETEKSNSNYINNTELKHSFEPNHDNTNISNIDKNNFNYLTIEDRNFDFDSNIKSIHESTNSKEISEINNSTVVNDISKNDNCIGSNIDILSNVQTLATVNDVFKLNINNSDIFETHLNNKNTICTSKTNENNKNSSLELSFRYENPESNSSNNSNTYQTNNLKKVHEFDFETRVLTNFEMDCSDSNAYKSTNSNENKIETQSTYDINNKEKKNKQEETSLEQSIFNQKEHTVQESLGLDRKNDDTQIHNGTKTENTNQKNKVDCKEEKLNHESYTDFDIQNKNTEEHNHNHFNTHRNLNNNNNAEVENIFKNLYDNLATLNTDKDHFSKNICQNDVDNCDISKNHNLISNDSEVIDDNLRETIIGKHHDDESDKSFEECNNVLLEKFVNNPSSHSAPDSLKKIDVLTDENNKELKSGEHNIWDSYKYIKNTNKNFLVVPKTVARENIVTLKEQPSKDIKQAEVNLINQNNMQLITNVTVDTVQSVDTKKIFENIKTDVLNTIQKIDSTVSKEHCQNNCSELISLNHDQQHSTKIVLIDNLINTRLNSLNDTELLSQHDTNDVFEIEDSTISESNSLNRNEKNADEIFEIRDTTNTIPNSLNDVGFIQNSNDTVEVEDSLKYATSYQQNQNEMVVVKNSPKYEPSVLNEVEVSREENSNEVNEVDDSASTRSSSLDDVEMTYQKHSNKTVEIKNKRRFSSLKYTKSIHQQNSNELDDIENSNCSSYNSLDDVESTCDQHSDDMVENKNSLKYKSCSLINTEFPHKQYSNDIDDADDLTSSYCNPLDDVELTYQQHSNDILETEDSLKSRTSLVNAIKLTCHKYSKEIVGVDNLINTESNLLDDVELTYQQHLNEIIDVNDSTNYSSLDDVESTCQQHSDEMIIDVAVSSKCELNSLNNAETNHDQYFNDLNDVDDSISSRSNSLDKVELANQKFTNDMLDAEDSPEFRSALLNNVEVTCQKHSNEMAEVDNSSKSESTSFNHTELTRQQHSNHIDQMDESNSLNDFGLIEHSHSSNKLDNDSFNIKSTECGKNDSDFISNDNSCLENKDSGQGSVIDGIKVPRVKFILKCHGKSMIKTNIFDDESIVSYKKLNVLKDKKIITGHIFKKQINFYKRWKSLCKKDMGDKSKEIMKDMVETVRLTRPEHILHNIECLGFDSKEENNDRVMSVPKLTFTNKEIAKSVEEINKSVNIIVNECTSSADNIHMEKQISERYARNDYWNKSLDNEYKNVLDKTVSKIGKNRVNIRDKFNIRSLARRTNETKRKKRRCWRRQRRRSDKTARFVVDDNGFASKLTDDRVEVPAAAVLHWTTTAAETAGTKCKIKVQLPWGRIFNLNNRLDANNYTKLELGPAKVEVRMSEMPGEWKVATCRSTTSSKSVVNVRRLVLQRAETTAGPSEGPPSDSGCNRADNGNTTGDNSDSGRSDGSNGNDDISGSGGNDLQSDCSRKLPKIVIRRNGLNNNYISYLSSGGFAGGNINEDSPQLMVRLVRDSNLDAMAVSGVTTLHLKHFIPESDTHNAKRARYA